jgi:tryptophan synthase alpha chain
MLEDYLKQRLQEKDILLMTHIVLGYPGFADSHRIVEAMVNAGVDIMELQIPFSEPMADGPVILKANQEALAAGTRVQQCIEFAEKVTAEFDIPFLFMTYYNIAYTYGIRNFAGAMAHTNIRGAIIPDLPPEEGEDYLAAMSANGLDPIFIFSPTTPDARMAYISEFASGLVYCVARKGVTGKDTDFSDSLEAYLQRCRNATALPLALGFGVKDRSDVDFLKGKVDIAVIGTQTIRLVNEKGVEAVEGFIRGLRD